MARRNLWAVSWWNAAVVAVVLTGTTAIAEDAAGLRVATFDVDATPPVGLRMAYDNVVRPADLSLRSRGVVILGADEPIVLVAVDWIGIGNDAHDAFRELDRDRLAEHDHPRRREPPRHLALRGFRRGVQSPRARRRR